MRTANGEAMDQKMECEKATPALESISVMKLGATADKKWLTTNKPRIPKSNFLNSTFEAKSIKGKDKTVTIQA